MKVQPLSDKKAARILGRESISPAIILFLAANPSRLKRLDLDEEWHTIENKIRAAKFSDQIRFRSRWATRVDDLLQALHEDAPSVLHFSGHGAGNQGLCFQGEDGGEHNVSADGLGQAVCAAGTGIKAIVLNACYSRIQAETLIKYVPCVIGVPDAIEDKSAIVYAADFYRALAFGKSVANAHQCGLAALALHSGSGQKRDIDSTNIASYTQTPELLTQKDIDASHIYIVQTAETSPDPRNDSGTLRIHLEFKFDTSLEEINTKILARLIAELCQISGDQSIQIVCIQRGSVRLTISLSCEAAKMLMELRNNGQLSAICGQKISDIIELGQVEILTLVPSTEEAQRSTKKVRPETTPSRVHVDLQLSPRTTGPMLLDDQIRRFLAAGKIEDATTYALRQLGPEILGFLSGVLGDEDGDEVFSAFSERFWQSLGGFQWRCRLRTWTYMLARHEISRFRRGARRHVEGRVPISELQEVLEAVRKTRSTLAARRSALTRLRNELPVEDRTLLILRVDRNFSFEDIALAFADDPDALGDDDIKQQSARLRKRFQLIKQRLISSARDADIAKNEGTKKT